MFTGLVEELGRVKQIQSGARSIQIAISARKVLEGVRIGDSIAVNGVCLTVTTFSKDYFAADVMPETMKQSSLGALKANSPVNLERALQLGDRLGGHIVSGHIDGQGKIRSKQTDDNAVIVTIEAPNDVMRYVVKKGSIAIDGISLTVVDCGSDWFSVSLIPHTAKVTVIGYKNPGDLVNLETDILGRYVEKMLQFGVVPKPIHSESSLNETFLQENGFF